NEQGSVMISRRRDSTLLILMALCLVVPAVSHVLAASPSLPDRPLIGNTPPGLARASLVGHADPHLPIRIIIALDLRDRAGAEAFVAAQHDPLSTLYNQWITPEEFQNRFGPLPEDLRAAEDFLVSRGFTGIERPASRMVMASGTIGLAEAAFGVTINDYLYEGRPVYANDRDPVLPAALASKLARVGGLDSLTRRFPVYSFNSTLYYTHRD